MIDLERTERISLKLGNSDQSLVAAESRDSNVDDFGFLAPDGTVEERATQIMLLQQVKNRIKRTLRSITAQARKVSL